MLKESFSEFIPRNFIYPFFWSFINVPTAILLLNIVTAVVLTIEN